MRNLLYIALPIALFAACKKEENPFDQLEHGTAAAPTEVVPEGSFAWLHQRIFRPICANSGCHDGSFEPDFRSMGSAYNSLVYAPVISNDPGNTFTYRVLPGNVQQSFLHERLTAFVPNTSGMMPLETDGPDWPQNEQLYINAITTWIQNGAPNMFGALPVLGNLEPQITGFLAFPAGNSSNAYGRGEGEGVQPIEVPASTVDLWFAVSDDATAIADLMYNKAKVAPTALAFASVPELPLATNASISGPEFGGGLATFTHKLSVDLTGHAIGTQLFIRVYIDDGAHDGPTEIPGDGTGSPMVDYFTLRIVP